MLRCICGLRKGEGTGIGSTILIRRSQEQPVMIVAAAGGKMMATRMRMMSEPLTMMGDSGSLSRCEMGG